ncbi:unnamed protein product [Adineta steineri]|uniref:Homeobox domain-containing protein n=1 Tax=Adineta steineri TaxID=433720 RepID=A0A815HRH5_9BILA|nr:unnamed protein product [Adineta steineri]CAF1355291.1 unnamed protein product [Adineta steineri]CAF1432788.1 unnamed protein product [Adineta steineri]
MYSINDDQTLSYSSDIDICNNTSSYCSPEKRPITSTPHPTNKPRVNFHSIESLAISSFTPISSPCQKHDDTGYNSSISISHLTKTSERKSRRKLSDWQSWYLCQIYAQNRYPSPSEQEQIASQLALPTSSIRIWFQNHRARYGKK